MKTGKQSQIAASFTKLERIQGGFLTEFELVQPHAYAGKVDQSITFCDQIGAALGKRLHTCVDHLSLFTLIERQVRSSQAFVDI